MLQFARLESLLQQAASSPGRQSWKADGEDQVRAATGDPSHCCLHAPLMLPFPWCTLCLHGLETICHVEEREAGC